jgi:ureidoglycolate dehydrogenase (NAD+)
MTPGEDSSPARIAPAELRTFTFDVLQRIGVGHDHAVVVSDALVRAELRGVDSHGLARLDAYARKFEAGGFNPDPDITVTSVAPAAVIVDADDGPGQSAGVRAMAEAVTTAKTQGVGLAAVTNSNHFGTAAYYTEQASAEDLIGLSMTNVESDVAPYGGTAPVLGTNPISVSIPSDREFPITLDMATSVVAMGKIDHARDKDDDIPDAWAFDAAGNPTTDPTEVAALRPVGGHKGYGLGIVVDVLCGVLTGAGTSPTAGPLYDDVADPMRLGHFFAAIDPSVFQHPEAFKSAVGEYIDLLKRQQPRDGVEEIRVPGEMEFRSKQTNEREGVLLNEDAINGIRTLASRYDVPCPDGLSQRS